MRNGKPELSPDFRLPRLELTKKYPNTQFFAGHSKVLDAPRSLNSDHGH